MKLNLGFLLLLAIVVRTTCTNDKSEYEYEYVDDDTIGLNDPATMQQANHFPYSDVPRSAIVPLTEAPVAVASTECDTEKAADKTTATTTESAKPEESSGSTSAPGSESGGATHSGAPTTPPVLTAATVGPPMEPAPANTPEQEEKAKELRKLVQFVYIAQARVTLEATEIRKAQAVANAAQAQLEEAANHVRAVTAALQNAQQEVASAAIRAQTAQLQLAAHDQLLFAARQDVDALSAQMVGLEAAEGISQPKVTFDLSTLMDRLKKPLPESEKPTMVPPVAPLPSRKSADKAFLENTNSIEREFLNA